MSGAGASGIFPAILISATLVAWSWFTFDLWSRVVLAFQVMDDFGQGPVSTDLHRVGWLIAIGLAVAALVPLFI